MKNKILIPLLVLGALATFFSFKYSAADTSDANKRKKIVLETVMKAVRDGHFSPRAVDDSLSYKVYHKILNSLDYDKKFFSAEDIAKLSPYEYKIDDQINESSTEFFDQLDQLFTKRINDVEGYYTEILKQPFTFTDNDSIQLTGDNIPYAANDTELKARWNQYLKYRVLAKYVDLKKDREKAKASKDGDKKLAAKTDKELEKEARESILKNHESYFKRLKKIDNNERFAIFINSITNVQDPHTDYFPPKDKQRFDDAMSGSFSGIGAQLKDEDGKVKIAAIITGAPAWKQGELKAGDEIMKVGQGKAEPVDIQGYEVDDVVTLIRGKKGTEVRLTVKRVDGAVKVIPITRGDVLLEEVFAKSAIIKSPNGPIGYIYLPEFYADFNQMSGRRSSKDVELEVQKLKASGVAGIIIDLRNNGGGSLGDVVDIAGLFIDEGPIVQVKSSGVRPEAQNDRHRGTLYDGPLAILVNHNSASASEILAAAMQDYKRAVVVGAPTFGKGTVQRIVSLDELLKRGNPLALAGDQDGVEGSIGAIKMTVQKFYRVNGGSTQLKGVVPDILLPDPYSEIEMGERRDKAALKWDEIPPANYKPVANPINTTELIALSNKRVNANPTFGLIKESAARIKQKETDNFYPLNEVAFRKELDEANVTSKKMEELEKKATLLSIINVKDDLANINRDSSTIKKNDEWIKALSKDIYLGETVNIVSDLMKQQSRVNMGTGMK
ncbi:MAG TPA: carboxy terminal-processing peptidase [Flavipsychrobacter sp.]|nr:carboxy terminal-processing peptidase [Flavipsychrobacter sp.]